MRERGPLAWAMSAALGVGGMGAQAGCARRSDPYVVVPERSGGPAAAAKGRDRGDVEIGLGAVTGAVAVTLMVLGGFAARRAGYLRERCGPPSIIVEVPDPQYEADCVDPTGFDPVVAASVSSALAFVIAVPIAVGSGFLVRKGVGMRRAFFKAQAQGGLSLRPWIEGGRAAGLGLSLRF